MSQLSERVGFEGIPGSCHLVGYLHECMPGAAPEVVGACIDDIIATPLPPPQDAMRRMHQTYNVDSLALIEMGMAVEDCASCAHGLGSAACRLGEVMAASEESGT